VTFDPREISYGRILQIYFSWRMTRRTQSPGPDVGTQYRSAIFPTDAEQARVAKAYIAQLNQRMRSTRLSSPKIEPGGAFIQPSYHQIFSP